MTDDGARAESAPARYRSRGHAAARFVVQNGILKPVVWSLVTVQIIGREKLRRAPKAFIVVANHSSHLDTPLIFGSLPKSMSRYLAAGAAADYFFDVWWRRGLTALFFNGFPVDRSGTHPRRVRAKDLLEAGVPLMVFPEGTRSKDLKVHAFKPGAASLSISTGAPIIPVALIGAGEAHPRGSSWPKPGRLPVGVVYGEPMQAQAGESAAEFMARVKAAIEGLIAEHGPRILASKNDQQAGTEPGGAST